MNIRCAHCKDRHESIAQVKACAQKPAIILAKKTPVTTPGVFRRGEDVFLVIPAKKNPSLVYAKKLVKTMKGDTLHKLHFEYEKGAIFQLCMEDKMTLEEVAKLGKTTGWCWVCGLKLKVQKSIEAGIGPVCIKKV